MKKKNIARDIKEQLKRLFRENHNCQNYNRTSDGRYQYFLKTSIFNVAKWIAPDYATQRVTSKIAQMFQRKCKDWRYTDYESYLVFILNRIQLSTS